MWNAAMGYDEDNFCPHCGRPVIPFYKDAYRSANGYWYCNEECCNKDIDEEVSKIFGDDA